MPWWVLNQVRNVPPAIAWTPSGSDRARFASGSLGLATSRFPHADTDTSAAAAQISGRRRNLLIKVLVLFIWVSRLEGDLDEARERAEVRIRERIEAE